MHKIFHPSGLCKWMESTTTPKTWPDWKSPFALSYILCVCYGGYQVCSAWTLHTQVLLIFKIHSQSVNAIFFTVLNSDSHLLKIRMISWWSRNRIWREGLGSVSIWVGSTVITSRHPLGRRLSLRVVGWGEGADSTILLLFHMNPASQAFAITFPNIIFFPSHTFLPKYFPQNFLTSRVAATPIFC